MLTIDRISAGYGKQVVIHGVSQDIDMRQITTLIGPNGHGKSTFMAAISGLRPLIAGRILLSGRNISKMSPQARLKHGMIHVPQGDRLFPDMSVEENLLIGGTVLESSAVVGRTLAWVYHLMPIVFERRRKQASALSGGERRMVAIARGLMSRCKFVMLDEPSLGLAPIAVEQVYKTIKRLHDDGYGFLIIEENMDRVSSLANRFMLIENGRIRWSGTNEELDSSGSALRNLINDRDVPVC